MSFEGVGRGEDLSQLDLCSGWRLKVCLVGGQSGLHDQTLVKTLGARLRLASPVGNPL